MDDERPLRIMTLDARWYGHGGATFNRMLSQALAARGHDVLARVGENVRAQPHPRLTVRGMEPVPGIDARGQLLRTDGLPDHVDVIIGHGRFSGGAAGYLRDTRYPYARVVHVMHALPDELDRWRGDPDQATEHARTERLLIGRADLAVGVGPLLAEEAGRLSRMNERATPIHELIPGIDVHSPPSWSDRQGRVNVLLFGRVDDPLKGADVAAGATRRLLDAGRQVQLTLRGADPGLVRAQELRLSQEAGMPVKVKPFTTDPHELAAEIRGADVVVMPSRNEGFGLVATEAAGHGVPVLVAGTSGAGWFLGDPARVPEHLGRPCVVPQTGMEPDLDRIWAEHLDRVVSDLPAARERARALRDHLAGRYTWESAAKGLTDKLAEQRAESTVRRTEAELARLDRAVQALDDRESRPPTVERDDKGIDR